MFLKKSLALGVVAALGSTATQAVFDIDATTSSGNVSIALESLDGNGGQAVGLVTYPKVLNTGNALNMVVKSGVSIPLSVTRYARFDMTNAVFTAAATVTPSTVANNAVALVAGGQAGTGFAVFSSKSSLGAAGLLATETLTVTSTTALALLPTMAAGDTSSVTFRMYEDLTKATNPATSLALYTKVAPTAFITTALGLKSTVTPSAAGNIAEVSTDFKKFTSTAISTTVAKLGTATQTVVASQLDAGTGVTALIGGLVNATTSLAVISGDFSIATQVYSMGTTNCASLSNLTINAAKTAAAGITTTNLIALPFLCMTVGATNTAAIPKGNFTIAIDNKTAETTPVNQPLDVAAGTVVGTIAHNGTTKQLPYITTFASYNQRVYMVNRGTSAATYTMTFQPETGTTAVAGTGAAGTIPAGGTLSVKASDIVTLTGKTRTAATLNIVGASGNISVMTQQVNLSDGGTDSINY
jgi:hypothetical protein